MLKNYFKLAIRNIGRKKLYTIINLTGLGTASAFCILIYLYVKHKRSFDTFHKNATALISVSCHTIKTAIANPVKSLRTE